MKRFYFCYIGLLVILLNGCMSTSSPTPEEQPRREFQILDSITATDPFIVNEFTSDNNTFTRESTYFSTALFLSDADKLESITKEQFEKYAGILFSNFPNEGELKEVVIPIFSSSKEENIEKNAYLFITKKKNNEGKDYYGMETNIPINSVYAKNYDGYVMRLNTEFYKGKIPARWTSVMSIMFNKDILLYRGVAYPSKSAPIIFTGTGIGSDVRMNSIISEQTSIFDTKKSLNETVKQTLETTKAESRQQADSMLFLEKFSNMSLSLYSYIDSDIEEAKKFFNAAKEIELIIPDDMMGYRFKELEIIMNYLLNTIEK